LGIETETIVMLQRVKRLIGVALLVIFALYYANITLFYHGHVINGVTIVHSHLHGKAHAQNGTHTVSELTLISALSTFHSCVAALFFIGLAVFLSLAGVFASVPERKIALRPAIYFSLRAPPAAA